MQLDHILIGIDFSESSVRAAHWTARHLAPHAELVLGHVIAIPEPPPIMRGRFAKRDLLVATVREGADKRLRDLARSLEPVQSRIEIREGDVATGLMQIAHERSVDAIVVGKHGEHATLPETLGSIAERLVREAASPVILTIGARERPPERILAPIDHSDASRRVLQAARSLGERFRADVVELHVVAAGVVSNVLAATAPTGDPPPRSATTAHDETPTSPEAPTRSGTDDGMEVTAQVVFGKPAREIVAYAQRWDSDLIVIGRHGTGGLRRAVLGSVVEAVLGSAPCPVLVMPD